MPSNQIERTCRYGHGPLQLNPETWGMEGVQWTKSLVKEGAAPSHHLVSTNRIFVVRLWVCMECDYVEMADDQRAGDERA